MNNMRIAEFHDCFGALFVLELHARMCLATLWILLCVVTGTAAAQPSPKNALFVFSTVKYGGETSSAIEPRIRAHVPGPVDFYYVYLDDPQSKENPYWATMAETVRQKYAGIKMDVVITDVTPSLLFAVKYRDKIFPGVPIVFLAVNQRELEGQKIWPGVTGVTNPLGFRETIDLALRLQPDTKAIAVVAGLTPWDSYWLAALRSELARYQDRLKEIDLVGIPNREMLKRVSSLPPHTVVMFQTSPQYSDEPDFGAWDLVTETAQLVPTYSVWPRFCVNGCIGGVFEDPMEEWRSAADLATRVLSGQRPEDLPIVHSTDLHVRVDWRALRRWHIAESMLPPGTVLTNREPTFWERNRNYIFAALAMIVLQALLILGLLWQRARKRKAEAVLRESEQRFRVMADTTPSLVWMCDAAGKIIYLNERRLEFTGPDSSAGYGDNWTEYVHPDDLGHVRTSLARALTRREAFSKEYRLRRRDGVYRCMFDVASPRFNGDGAFAGFIGSAIDVTDQKLAQEALEKVSGRLIEAQERERRRIARDLHDDICQRLALLSMALEQANRGQNESAGSPKPRLEEIRKTCSEIASDVQSLSHELHSSKLDYLGVAASIRGFCKEFANQHELTIEFKEENVPKQLPRDVSLCLFRVTQEALHNAAKYSGTDQFWVKLRTLGNYIRLEVWDSGTGFDVDKATMTSGLGLVSMQERVHLVQGELTVDSKPGSGTRIIANIPAGTPTSAAAEDTDARKAASVTDAA